MKHRCAKVSGNAMAVNGELKMSACIESKTETDSETSGPQPSTSKKREENKVKNTLEQEKYHFHFISYFGNIQV